jgi:WD40 repeat protein
MRIFRAVLTSMVLAASLYAQAAQDDKSLFTFKGRFDFDNPAEKVVSLRFPDDGKLWMLGAKSIQVWNTNRKEVLLSQRHGIDDLANYSLGEISPDGSKLFYRRRKRIDYGDFISAYIFDLNTLKTVRTFDAPSLMAGYWSNDGRTFITYDQAVKSDDGKTKYHRVSFWNGDTLEPGKALNIPDLDWSYLNPEGTRFLTTSVPTKKWLGLIPNEMANKATMISVWNVQTGQKEKDLAIGDEEYGVLTWKLMPSPSGRYMAMIAKHKSDSEEHKILFWELNSGSDSPKYAIKANPKLSDSNIRYSPDEKYFAVDSGKNIQVYRAENGEKRGEIANTNLPDYWLTGDQVLLNIFAKKMRAFSIVTGDQMYENPLIYESYDNSSTDANGQTTSSETIVTDQTIVVPHPFGKIYLTYSNEYVKVFRADTGELLETLVRPPLTLNKSEENAEIRRQLKYGKPVRKAGWSDNGRILWVIEGSETAISLWDVRDH